MKKSVSVFSRFASFAGFASFAIPAVGCGTKQAENNEKGNKPTPISSEVKSGEKKDKENAAATETSSGNKGENDSAESKNNNSSFSWVDSKNGTYKARISQWNNGPTVTTGQSTRNNLTVSFDETFLSFDVQTVFPYMKIHGHGVPKSFLPSWKILFNSSEPNFDTIGTTLNVENFGLVMSGPWELVIKFSANGIADELEIPFEVP